MKVKELKKMLEAYPNHYIVVLQSDLEGNGYSPLYSHWQGVYVPDSPHSGEAYLEEITEEDGARGYTEEDTADPHDGDNERAVILVPTN